MNDNNQMKFIKDVLLNLFSSGSAVVILQIIVYPFFNIHFKSDAFGILLIDIAIINVIGVFLGGTLTNIRLKFENSYREKNIKGDFPILLVTYVIMGLVLSFVFFTFRDKTFIEILSFSLVPCLMILRTYLQIEYRLNLQYNKILVTNLIYTIGLMLGLTLVNIFNAWILVFIVSEILALVFLFATTSIIREPFRKTILFLSTLKNSLYLAISSVISNIIIYLDRFIISIFMDAYMVAVFFASVVIGKMSTFILSPISSVILSHLSRKTERISMKTYFSIHILLIIFGLVTSLITVYLTVKALPLLYPNLLNDALPILKIAPVVPIIQGISTIPLTIVLKYSKTFQQVNIQFIYGILYFILGITFLQNYGLLGFCFGVLVANVINYLIITFVGYRSLKSDVA